MYDKALHDSGEEAAIRIVHFKKSMHRVLNASNEGLPSTLASMLELVERQREECATSLIFLARHEKLLIDKEMLSGVVIVEKAKQLCVQELVWYENFTDTLKKWEELKGSREELRAIFSKLLVA